MPKNSAATALAVRQEQQLVAASCNGDLAAFEQLYRHHHRHIYALCWRLCGCDRQWAEDMLQETFIQAWRKLDGFRGEARFASWLHRLAVNQVLAERRRGSARVRHGQVELVEARHPVSEAESHADTDLERAIAGLPARARLVLVMHELEGYTHAEIGAMTGMAEGTSRAQLNRARRLLRQQLLTGAHEDADHE